MNREALTVGLVVVGVVGVLALIPASLISSRLWRAIKLRHPRVWTDLDAPSFAPMSMEKSRRLRDFVRRRQYEELEDPEINSLARNLRVLNSMISIAVWVGMALVGLLAIDSTTASRGS